MMKNEPTTVGAFVCDASSGQICRRRLHVLASWPIFAMLAACTPTTKPSPQTSIALPSDGDRVPSLAATIAAMPKNIPRPLAPGLDESIAAARAAVRACNAKGAKVSVLVSDVEAQPVVLLSGDGAGYRSQLIARSKVRTVVRFGLASGTVEQRSKSDPALLAAASADPDIGVLRGGGFPIMRDGKMIGAVAVSGASLTGPIGLDEECAAVALALLESQTVTPEQPTRGHR